MIMPQEQRRVQKTGIATFTISLPKPWITKNKINAGEILSIVEEKDGSLHISKHLDQETSEEKLINTDKKIDSHIIRELIGHYLNGLHQIRINSKDDLKGPKRKNLLKQVKRMIGFEIVEEDKNKIILQDFFSADYLSIIKSLKRAYDISSLMLRESIRILKGEKFVYDNIEMWEDEVDRLYLLVRRQLGFAIRSSLKLRQLNLSSAECLNYLLLIKEIESLTDNISYVALNSYEINKKIDKGLINKIEELSNMLLEVYNKAINSILAKDASLANTMLDQKSKILSKINAVGAEQYNLNKKNLINVETILFNMFNILLHIGEISEIAIDQILQ